MERDYEWSSAVPPRRSHGRPHGRAQRRQVRRAPLNPRKAKSARVPVVYDRRVSGGLIGHLAGAINGRAVARGTSFLKDKMGEKIFAAASASSTTRIASAAWAAARSTPRACRPNAMP